MELISRKESKEQGLKRYFTGKPCKHGHVSERFVSDKHCCACKAERKRKHTEQNKEKVAERMRKYYKQNKEKINERGREYYEQNKDMILEQKREYHERNKKKLTETSRKYYEQNKDMILEQKREYHEKNKEYIAKYKREYYRANPEQVFIRNSLNRTLSNWKGSRAKAEKLLGYTCEQLREHIESQFKEGMSWDNRSEWHVDHKKPIKAFLDEGITDHAIINALDNLQPLWARENLSKGAKYER